MAGETGVGTGGDGHQPDHPRHLTGGGFKRGTAAGRTYPRGHEPQLSARSWEETPGHLRRGMASDVVLDCGWGRLVFGHTFEEPIDVLDVLRSEEEGERDICLYPRDPHVLVSRAPDELFIDPSFTYRIAFSNYRPRREVIPGVVVRKLQSLEDANEVNRIYASAGMVTADPELMWSNQRTPVFTYLVAEDARTAAVVGTVTGIDHVLAFGDPEGGSSLWSLAVERDAAPAGTGEALVRVLVERYAARGRLQLDLSVLHDNAGAIALYEKLGFRRVPVFAVKRKNTINEPLFTGGTSDIDQLNPYARIIADEARRRGIRVDVIDAEWGEMRLTHGGRSVVTRESLSELTSAVAMSRCDDKRITRRTLERVGLRVPRGQLSAGEASDTAFLAEVGALVVKPSRGEQGRGITVGVTDPVQLRPAVEHARSYCPDVLLEEYVAGLDLRIVVIDHEVVAAAERRPATVVGDGRHTVRELVDAQSRRRARATGGESRIPLDERTEATVRAAGHSLDDVLAEGEPLAVQRTANLHTGGTIHDVTAQLHPALAAAAVTASRALDVPVTGLDLLVPAVDGPDYAVIEANERPGLANHEPQPTAERFVDLLFPATSPRPRAWRPPRPGSRAGR